LLPVGITRVIGQFKKGDLIKILDENEREIGLGLARYGDKQAKEAVGLKNQKPVIHYDHLYLH
jgi:glutamate 5-kinase